MRNINELSLSAAVRFGLTGFVALTLFLFIPLTIFAQHALQPLFEIGGAISVLVCAIALGFVIDGLKLYQISFNYNKDRKEFNKEIAIALAVEPDLAPVYFVKAAQLEREKGLGHIDFIHSRWVSFDTCAKLFLTAGILWILITVGFAFLIGFKLRLACFILISVGCFALGLRTLRSAHQEKKRASAAYIEFCVHHRKQILASDVGTTPRKKVQKKK